MKTDKTNNWTKTTCDTLGEVAEKLGLDMSKYPFFFAESKDVDDVHYALLTKYGVYSGILNTVYIKCIPTIDYECYWELYVSPKFAGMKEIA